MKIAICEDNIPQCQKLSEHLIRFSNEINLGIDTVEFYTGNDFITAVKTGEKFDLCFLDINLEESASGVEIGKILREIYNFTELPIFYISSDRDYAMDLFQNQPFDFIIKPITYEDIERNMNKFCSIYLKNKSKNLENKCKIVTKDSVELFEYDEILFFEGKSRYGEVQIHTTRGCFCCKNKLDSLLESVNDGRFIRIHQSFFVNFIHIVRVKYRQLFLSSGDVLPISQKFRANIRESLDAIHMNRANISGKSSKI